MKKYRPPNSDERVVFFNYLKRATSLSAWERVLHCHREVVETIASLHGDATNSNEVGPRGRPFVNDRELLDFQNCHRILEEAVEKLRLGDRSCFRWSSAPGHFSAGLRMMDVMNTAHSRVFQGEGKAPVMKAPRWPELEVRLRECFAAKNYCAGALESRFLDVPAYLFGPEPDLTGRPNCPFTLLSNELSTLSGPPELGDDEPVSVVRSGETVPCSGVWEPCVIPSANRGLLGLFRRQRFVVGDLVTNPEGCMNYLHEGGNAPTIAFPGDSVRREGKSVCWYLLWEDNRYGRHQAPVEESSYTYPEAELLDFPELPY